MEEKCCAWSIDESILADYRAALPNIVSDPGIFSWASNYAAWHMGRCDWDAKFLLQRYPAKRLLNVGGAPFLFEYALRRGSADIEIVSIDLSPDRFEKLTEVMDVKVIAADIERVDRDHLLKWSAFDIVVFCEVFEHLRINIIETMHKLALTLSKDGVLYITMPNGVSLKSLWRNVIQRRTGPPPVGEWQKLEKIGHMGHVREYSALEISEILNYCGFVIEERFFRCARPKKNWTGVMKSILMNLAPSLMDEVVIIARLAKIEPRDLHDPAAV